MPQYLDLKEGIPITAVLLLALALGMDAFSAAVGLGITGIRPRHAVIFLAAVALFHVVMPLGGWILGTLAGHAVGELARIFGASVLILMGALGLVEVIRTGIVTGNQGVVKAPVTPGWQSERGLSGLLILAGSVSLDALSVGFGLGTIGGNLLFTIVIFGATAGIMAGAGFLLGHRLGYWLGNKADVVGALIIIVIGINMLR